jgi:hypothetical protein
VCVGQQSGDADLIQDGNFGKFHLLLDAECPASTPLREVLLLSNTSGLGALNVILGSFGSVVWFGSLVGLWSPFVRSSDCLWGALICLWRGYASTASVEIPRARNSDLEREMLTAV